MKDIVIGDASFIPDRESLLKSLHIKNSYDIEAIFKLCDEAQEVARPKYLYKVSFIDGRDGDSVVLDGVTFHSRVMSVNLSVLNRAFPLIATSGREIEEWSEDIPGMLLQYWADKIKEMALENARRKGIDDICKRYNLKRTSFMSPGSITDWPLSEQAGLFSLLGDVESDIGVELTDSFLMLPPKSVSLILFEADTDYENCQLCPRENCPNRRAAYVPDLYEKRYELQH